MKILGIKVMLASSYDKMQEDAFNLTTQVTDLKGDLKRVSESLRNSEIAYSKCLKYSQELSDKLKTYTDWSAADYEHVCTSVSPFIGMAPDSLRTIHKGLVSYSNFKFNSKIIPE